MTRPTLCMIFEATGPYNAIGKVAMNGVRIALDAGWQVTVVAHRLDEDLQNEVEWLRLFVPPRLFFVQWTSARHFIRKALGSRTFDVVHAHQPQVADLSDVFQCHYLTRAACERKCLTGVKDLRSAFVRLQEQGVLYAEDFHYKHWNPKTKMLYDSALTRQDFHRIYGPLPDEDTLVYAFPPLNFPTEEERRQARTSLVGDDHRGLVLGFLGGTNDRKGYRRLIKGLEGENDVYLLMGGNHCDGFEAPSLKGRFKSLGLVMDLKTFYHACDAFIVPSHYEPLGLVCFEAAAHGVPVIATDEVGALPHMLEHSMGFEWVTGASLPALVHHTLTRRAECNLGTRRAEAELGVESYGRRLLDVYNAVRENKGRGVDAIKAGVVL